MDKIKIITDSSSDMSPEEAAAAGVDVIPIVFTLDGEAYLREWIDMTPEAFYHELRSRQDLFPKTSQPSTQAYIDAFRSATEDGKRPALYLSLTGKFSQSYNGSLLALDMFREQFPNAAEIVCMDSRLCTGGLRMLVKAAAEMSDEGMDMRSIIANCEKLIESHKIYVTVDSLEYLRKGGRIGKAGALMGGLLNIKPLIAFYDGELHPTGKVRGRAKALADVAKSTADDVAARAEDYNLAVFHADCLEDAQATAKMIADGIARPVDIDVYWLGTIIGCHIGPTTIATCYMRKWRSL